MLRQPHKLAMAVCLLTTAGLMAACGQPPVAVSGSAVLRGIDVPNLPNGPRAATYDPQHDCLWIMSRVVGSDTSGVVVLMRLDVNSDDVTSTPLRLSGDGYISGTVAIDRHGLVWLGWGQTIAKYDPSAGSSRVFHIPGVQPITGVADPGVAGRMVAMTIDPEGEIWLALYGATKLYGFDIESNTFDRTLPISVTPFDLTRLQISGGKLLVNGLDRRRNPPRPTLEKLDPGTGYEASAGVDAVDFTLGGDQSLVYVDLAGRIGKASLNSTSGQSGPTPAPVAPSPLLTTDSVGNTWFSMSGRDLVGLGELTSAGVVQEYPFPQPVAPSDGPDPACPPQNAQLCASGHAVFNPEIQAIQVDRHGDVWVITRVSGSGDPTSFGGLKPIYELATAG